MKIINSYLFNINKSRKVFICYLNNNNENSYKIIEPRYSIKIFKIDKYDELKYIIRDPEELFYVTGMDKEINMLEYAIRNNKYIKFNTNNIHIYKKTKRGITEINLEEFFNQNQFNLDQFKVLNKYYYFSYFDKIFGNLEHVNLDELNVGYFDIEVVSDGSFPVPDKAEYPISLISIFSNKKDIYELNIIINNNVLEYHNIDIINDPLFDNIKEILNIKNIAVNIFNEKNEVALLNRFIKVCKKINVLSGWNSVSFDFKYLYNRAKKNNVPEFIDFFYPMKTNLYTIEKDFEKNNSNSFWKNTEIDTFEFIVLRIPNIDYNTLIKTALVNKSFSSYKLGFIAEKILGEGITKVNINLNKWNTDVDRYIKYNIMDAMLVCGIEKKMNLLRFLFDLRKIVGFFPLNKISSNIILQSYIFNILKSNAFKNYSIMTNRKEEVNNRLFKIYKTVNNYDI